MDEVVAKRTRNSKTYLIETLPDGRSRFSWDGKIGAIHYKDDPADPGEQWKDIDSEFLPAAAPWDWQMIKAGYHIRVKEDFTAGQIIEFEKQGETIHFQPIALEWTNDLNQIQQISMPQNVPVVVSNPVVDLFPAVGVPSHEGTIRWNSGYGSGIDFEWRCTLTRLVKIIEIESFASLPTPQQYIIDGGNPVLRLNLIFAPSSAVEVYVDGLLWDKNTKRETFSIIEFRKDGEVLWGFMPLRYWGNDPQSADNEGQSIATVEKRGNSLYISIRVPYSWLQGAAYPVFLDVDVDEQVDASLDDALEKSATGEMNLLFGYWVMGNYSAYNCSGARFASVTIPVGAIIDVAYLTFEARADDSGNFENDLYGEDDAAPLAFAIGAFNITNRTTTTAVVQCDGVDLGNWANGFPYNSPSIVSIITELVGTYDYSAGRAMVILAIWQDAFEERLAWSWNGTDPLDAPKLHIEYSLAGGGGGGSGGLAAAAAALLT